MEGVRVKVEPGADFLPAATWDGSKAGYVFKTGNRGVGYYFDHNAPGAGGASSAPPAAAAAAGEGRNRAAVAPGVAGMQVKVEGRGLPGASGKFQCTAAWRAVRGA
jgi:hypothetical protein